MTGPLDSMSSGDDYQSGPVGPRPSSPRSEARRPAVARTPPPGRTGADAAGPGGAPTVGPEVAAGAGPGVGPAPAIPPGADPWQVFAVAVLALHRRLKFPALDRVMCSCGRLDNECPIAGLAERCGLAGKREPPGGGATSLR